MRGGKKSAAALATLVASLPFVHAARAQQATPTSPVTLTWNAPAGCSDSETILKEVAHLRGDASRADKLDATATVSLNPSGVWNLQITTILPNGTHGERQIQAESCKAAADATASILALALTEAAQATPTATSPAVATATPTTTATSTATTAPTSTVAPPPSTADQRPSTNDRRPRPSTSTNDQRPSTSTIVPHLYFGASLGGTSGDLPSLGFGALGEIGVAYGVLRVEGYGGYWALGIARFSTPGGAHFQLLDAGARTCLSFGDTLQLGPCAAFELGSMRGESFDVSRPSSGSALDAEALLGGLGTLSLDKSGLVRIRALLEIGPVVDRPQFVLDGVGFVHQPAPVVGRGTIGALVSF